MSAVFRVPHAYIRRNLSGIERALAAAGFSLLLYQVLVTFPAYPSPWEVVLAATIFGVMLWSPWVAYFLAVTAVLYPLYTVSLYVAVLFLAAALLGNRIIVHNLGAALLVLLAPWLAQLQLAWMVPLLAGLWWGKSGAWIGALAALWSQLLFGMSGLPPDLLAALGSTPSLAALAARFGPADSLDTLLMIVSPLAPNPTLLLYHLLQITVWAMSAALVGGFAERRWAQQHRTFRAPVIAFCGALGLLAGHIGLAAWLEQYSTQRFIELAPQLVLAVLACSVTAAALDGLRDFAERPLPVGYAPVERSQPARANPARRPGYLLQFFRRNDTTAQPAADTPLPSEPYAPMQVPANLPRREGKKEKPDDIIKIELD